MADFTVLMSAGASPAAVSIIRHLKSLGYKVRAMDANEKALPLAAGEADEAVLAPMAIDSDYIPFIREQMGLVDLFIPFIDEEIHQLLRHYDEAVWNKCLLPGLDTTRTCLYKDEFQRFCIEKGLPAAPAVTADGTGLPAVFKPRMGRGGRGVEVIRTVAGLKEKMPVPGVMQRFIKGDETTIDALFSKNHELVRISARRRDAASGVSTIGTIADPAPFLPVVQALGRALKFRYLVNIQVIRDHEGGSHLIEINPRVAGSVIFTVLSGLDFLQAAVDIFRDRPVDLPADQKKIRVIRYWSEHVENLSD